MTIFKDNYIGYIYPQFSHIVVCTKTPNICNQTPETSATCGATYTLSRPPTSNSNMYSLSLSLSLSLSECACVCLAHFQCAIYVAKNICSVFEMDNRHEKVSIMHWSISRLHTTYIITVVFLQYF